MAETALSSIKRMFGKHITARKFPNGVQNMVSTEPPEEYVDDYKRMLKTFDETYRQKKLQKVEYCKNRLFYVMQKIQDIYQSYLRR
ncbi:MAG: hypothetical protein WBP64_17820 [Nitrososphaeraceae archaeon]